MHRPFSASARALLDAGTDPRARRFADAVVRQVAFPTGQATVGPADAGVAAALVRFLHAAEGNLSLAPPHSPPPSAELLSSIFQNVDLLYADGYADADRVSLLLMSIAWEDQSTGAAGSPEPPEET